jgi:hypothetical protein
VVDPTYQERYCAFVDILGFRELIDSLDQGSMNFGRLRALLQKVQDPYRGPPDAPFGDSDFRAQCISDAVALSANPNPNGLQHLFFVLEQLSLDLLFEGYLLRGAIVKGPLYHDDRMVFGKALIDAYQLESEVVRYPRIMLTRQVVFDAGNSPIHKILSPFIRQSDDGPYYLHVLRLMAHDIAEELKKDPDVDPSENEQLGYYIAAGNKLRTRVSEAVDNPRIFEKVKWFARYWNAMLPRNKASAVGRPCSRSLIPQNLPKYGGKKHHCGVSI